MVKTDFYTQRIDGVRLYRTYSDDGMMIRKDGTDELYSEAIDVEDSGFGYTQTDVPIDGDTELTLKDTLSMLGKLGVDVSDEE